MRYKMEAMVMRIQARRMLHFIIYTHQCYQSWYCWFHRVWSDAPDHHTVVFSIHITLLWNWWRIIVHNVFLNTQCMRYCDVIHIAPYKICTKYFFRFIMKTKNPLSKHKRIFLMHLERFSTQNIVRIKILTIVLFKYAFL